MKTVIAAVAAITMFFIGLGVSGAEPEASSPASSPKICERPLEVMVLQPPFTTAGEKRLFDLLLEVVEGTSCFKRALRSNYLLGIHGQLETQVEGVGGSFTGMGQGLQVYGPAAGIAGVLAGAVIDSSLTRTRHIFRVEMRLTTKEGGSVASSRKEEVDKEEVIKNKNVMGEARLFIKLTRQATDEIRSDKMTRQVFDEERLPSSTAPDNQK